MAWKIPDQRVINVPGTQKRRDFITSSVEWTCERCQTVIPAGAAHFCPKDTPAEAPSTTRTL